MKTSIVERVDTTMGCLVAVGRECACAAAMESYGWWGNRRGGERKSEPEEGKSCGVKWWSPWRQKRSWEGLEACRRRGGVGVLSQRATELVGEDDKGWWAWAAF